MSQDECIICMETTMKDESKTSSSDVDKDFLQTKESNKRTSKRTADKSSNGVTTKRPKHCTTKILPKITEIPRLKDNDVLCAYEAFYLDTDVILKEVAFYFLRNKDVKIFHIRPPFDIKHMKNDIQAELEMQTIFGHHLPWNSGKLLYSELAALLYEMTSKHNLFVYAPATQVNPFKDYSHVNLADCGIQNPVFIPQDSINISSNACPVHGHLSGNCALKTVLKLANYMNPFEYDNV